MIIETFLREPELTRKAVDIINNYTACMLQVEVSGETTVVNDDVKYETEEDSLREYTYQRGLLIGVIITLSREKELTI